MPLTKAVVNTTAVYSILNPKHNIKVNLNGEVVEAALVKFAFKPLKDGEFGPKRDNPSKMVPASTWNYWQTMPLRNGHHQAYIKGVAPMPQYAALVEDVDKFVGARLLSWNGQLTVTQEELDSIPVVSGLSGNVKDGFHAVLEPDYVAMEQAVAKAAAEGNVMVVDSIAPSSEEVVEDLPEIPVEETAYTGDPFTQDPETGHFIGDDGFRVPRDFAEFVEWNPRYIENWTKRRLGRNAAEMDVEDWTSDLNIHMGYLPVKSKHRLPGANGRPEGCSDVVMTFNPIRQYGASERRFRHYINNCLANRFSTIQSKRQKNPVCRVGNLSMGSAMDPENFDVVDDEYVHAHSEILTRQARSRMKQDEQSVFVGQFTEFVEQEDPEMLKVVYAIESTGTFGEAMRDLNMTEQEFGRARNRLKQLAQCFQEDMAVPKQRKPYKKREAVSK
jgi:hypothetical protein